MGCPNNPDFFHPNINNHNHQHEQPDTLIPMHVLDASKTDGDIRYIDTVSPGINVRALISKIRVF